MIAWYNEQIEFRLLFIFLEQICICHIWSFLLITCVYLKLASLIDIVPDDDLNVAF